MQLSIINLIYIIRCERIDATMCGRTRPAAAQAENSGSLRRDEPIFEEKCLSELYAVYRDCQRDFL